MIYRLRHAGGYITFSEKYDLGWIILNKHAKQLIVVMFLFYSGYGIMEMIKKKKADYLRSFFKKRFVPVYAGFAIAVGCYLLLNTVLGIEYDTRTTLLSFTGWTTIGNSNWYMFTVFILYLLIILCFIPLMIRYDSRIRICCTILFTVAVIACILLEKNIALEKWWYNTMIAFPFGMWFSLLKDKIDSLLDRSMWIYWIFLLIAVSGLLAYKRIGSEYPWMDWSVKPMAFAMLIILLTMRIKISSSVFSYMGTHLFSLFILQRLPMIILSGYGIAQPHRYYFLIISFIATVILSLFFDWLMEKINPIFRS